nr:immunoglobulin heavy chain junction region [Macaca mulatta]MOV36108.1 immunoglobulin heavy chain junction region [Macaca mulatta]MOV36115.1 immunoglobulin heavy chain junction region [Macaca mulatta]MOV36247.1 immunoglobulin heavy chain junction region [Macaca mulatta]MOV36311.1 immunoglobulin heavy chain junction region [Macaca mulatta]
CARGSRDDYNYYYTHFDYW